MACDVGKLDFKFLESQIRLIEQTFGRYDCVLYGLKRIKSIMDTYGVDALEELAKVARHFGTKREDRRLNMYIHIWIKMCLSDFMVASFPDDWTNETRRSKEYFAEYLTQQVSVAYSEPMGWLDKVYHILEYVVALGRGIVEARILEAAAKAIRVKYSHIDVELDCRDVVIRGFADEAADDKYDHKTKLRALLSLGSTFSMPYHSTDRKIDDFEEEAQIALKLLKSTQEVVQFCDDEEKDMAFSSRWYSSGCVFAKVCHSLAMTRVSDDLRCEMLPNNTSPAFPYLQRAALCSTMARGMSPEDYIHRWRIGERAQSGEPIDSVVNWPKRYDLRPSTCWINYRNGWIQPGTSCL